VIESASVEQGSEAAISGSLADTSVAGDGVVVVIDEASAPIAAAPIERSPTASTWAVRIPTFDLQPGVHRADIWIVKADGTSSTFAETVNVIVEPRVDRIPLFEP
jgi:hypothetical protein